MPRTIRPPLRSPSSFDATGVWWRRLVRAGRLEFPNGFVLGVSVLIAGAMALVAGAASLFDGGRDGQTMVVLAVVWIVMGSGLAHQCRVPDRLRSSAAYVGVLVVWLGFIGTSTVTYLALDLFAHADDAVFESVAGFTTTASTVVADPEALSRAALTWRALTQWVGGLTGLLFVVAVLPSLGVGGLDVTTAGARHSGTSLRSRRTLLQLRHLSQVYVVLTAAGVALFLVSGLDPFDAVTYAVTTISTGGFANHSGSFGHFSSASVEWAGFGGMVLGGANLALLFRAVRGRDPLPLLRSPELRAYLVLVAVAGAVVAWTTAPAAGLDHTAVRHAYFHVASATSTTGHFVGEGWAPWDTGPQLLLVAIMGVGAMSGSAGGGFRQVRALALIGYLRRELVLQVHPRATGAVRVGRRIVSEELVNRMIGYQAQYLVVAGLGAVGLAATGTELVTAIGGAVSALANVGPGLGDLAPADGGVLGLPRPARVVLMPLMLFGRLEIAPVLVGASILGTATRRRTTRRRRPARDRLG